MLEGVRDYAILMLSAEGRVMTWNTGPQAMQGYRAQDVIGQSVLALLYRGRSGDPKAL